MNSIYEVIREVGEVTSLCGERVNEAVLEFEADATAGFRKLLNVYRAQRSLLDAFEADGMRALGEEGLGEPAELRAEARRLLG